MDINKTTATTVIREIKAYSNIENNEIGIEAESDEHWKNRNQLK